MAAGVCWGMDASGFTCTTLNFHRPSSHHDHRHKLRRHTCGPKYSNAMGQCYPNDGRLVTIFSFRLELVGSARVDTAGNLIGNLPYQVEALAGDRIGVRAFFPRDIPPVTTPRLFFSWIYFPSDFLPRSVFPLYRM